MTTKPRDAEAAKSRHDETEFVKKLASRTSTTEYRDVLDLVAGLLTPIGVQVHILRSQGLERTPQEEQALKRIDRAATKVADLIDRVRFQR